MIDIKRLEKASEAYYSGNPLMTDAEFDMAIAELQESDPDSYFLKRIGAPVPGVSKAKHAIQMGSLNNIHDEKEFRTWVPSDGPYICLSHKLDGSSLELVYKDGHFIQAITRGDGEVGEDVTRNVLASKNVPLSINPLIVSVRCECLILKDDWENHFEGDANPRNSAAGTLRRHDGRNAEYLRFYAFDAIIDEAKKTPGNSLFTVSDMDTLDMLSLWFLTPSRKWSNDPSTMISWYKKEEERRDCLSYEIDGIVAKIDDRQASFKMGIVNGHPKGQVAIKFKPRGGETVLRSVTWQVGHTGVLSPVGIVDPVGVGGTTIRRVTLCNMDEIDRLGIAIGDTIEIIRACDVIPKLSKMIKKGSNRKLIHPPLSCPACCLATTRDGAHIRCRNHECTLKSYHRVMNWVKKRNILNVGIKLIIAAKIKTISQLYKTSMDEWEDVRISNRIFGEKRAKKVIDALEKSKIVSLPDFLGSLGIKGVGRSLASGLCEHFSGLPDSQLTLKDIFWLKEQDVAGHEKFGKIRASDFCDWLQQHKVEIEVLADMMDIQYETNDEKGIFDGEVICFTGKSPKPRPEMIRLAEAAGALVSNSVNSNTTILVVADTNKKSSKSIRAGQFGIRIMSTQDFMIQVDG